MIGDGVGPKGMPLLACVVSSSVEDTTQVTCAKSTTQQNCHVFPLLPREEGLGIG